jgi:hypothetical protein
MAFSLNNGDRHFSKLFNVEETKGIIHSRIFPARDVVQSVWYNISQVQLLFLLSFFIIGNPSRHFVYITKKVVW